MSSIRACALPDHALLQRYKNGQDYVDCFAVTVSGSHSQADYVQAFYCTRLFKLERLVLGVFLKRPSSDEQAAQLARAEVDGFAAWRVEDHATNQLLMCDLSGQTRSWLMTEAIDSQSPQTRLYFGSAVVHPGQPGAKTPQPSWLFRALLRFHKWYSVALLRSARTALRKAHQRS